MKSGVHAVSPNDSQLDSDITVVIFQPIVVENPTKSSLLCQLLLQYYPNSTARSSHAESRSDLVCQKRRTYKYGALHLSHGIGDFSYNCRDQYF